MFRKYLFVLCLHTTVFPTVMANSLMLNFEISQNSEKLKLILDIIVGEFRDYHELIIIDNADGFQTDAGVYNELYSLIGQAYIPTANIDHYTSIEKFAFDHYLHHNYTKFSGDTTLLVIIFTQLKPLALAQVISSCIGAYFWRARMKIIIVVTENESNPVELSNRVQRIFTSAWSLMILNCVLIYQTNDTLMATTYNPFNNETLNCTDNIQECFPDKLRNLYGYELTVSMNSLPIELRKITDEKGHVLRYEGLDGTLCQVIGEKINATIMYVTPKDNDTYGDILAPGTLTGTLGDVYNKRAQFSFVSRFLNWENEYYVESVDAYFRNDLSFLVPIADPIPEFQNYFRTYTMETVELIGCCIFGFIIFVIILRYFERKLIDKRFINNHLFTDIVKLSVTAPTYLRYHLQALNISLMAYGVFTYVICTIFVGNLFNVLTIEKTLPPPDTVDEVEATSFDLVTTKDMESLMRRFFNNDNLLRRLKVVNSEELVHSILTNHRQGYVIKDSLTLYFRDDPMNLYGNTPLYHIADEKPVPSIMGYVGRPGNPFMQRISRIARATKESGLDQHWYTNMQNEARWEQRKHIKAHQDWYENNDRNTFEDFALKINKPLNLSSFFVPFIIISFGHLFSALVFFFELFNFYLKKKLRKAVRDFCLATL